MALPVPHRLMMTRAGLAHVGSASQMGGRSPKGSSSGVSAALRRPNWPLKIHIQRKALATDGVIEGR